MIDASVFERHLDLTPLRGRRRGVVPCIFHRDRTPSLSIDLERGLFNCFACGERGGMRRFRELVGEQPLAHARAPEPEESEQQRAQRVVLEAERRRQDRMADWGPYLRSMAWLRKQERLVESVRTTATDTEVGWGALADAAVVESFVDRSTAEIEGILARGRVA